MCQWKHILLLQRNQNVQRHPNLGPTDRPLLVPESLTSLTKHVLQAYEMEGGDLLPSTQMIPPSIIQQTPLQHIGEGKHNEYVPVNWETNIDQESIQAYGCLLYTSPSPRDS